MQRITRHRKRPDNMRTEIRAAKRGNVARYLYFGLLAIFFVVLFNTLMGDLLALHGEGLLTRKGSVVTPAYDGTIERLLVDEGDQVSPGQPVAQLSSRQIRDRLIASQARVGTAAADLATARAEVAHLKDLLAPARRELARAREHNREFGKLRDDGLVAIDEIIDVAQAAYGARKEVQRIQSQLTAAQQRLSVHQEAVTRARDALQEARGRFADGMLTAGRTGVVAESFAREGAFVKQGDPVFEIMHGEPYVVAYMPVGTAYHIEVNEAVVLRFGMRTIEGRITELKPVARRLPSEFQQVLHSAQRERLVAIEIEEGIEVPPLSTKFVVTTDLAPLTLLARGVMILYGLGNDLRTFFNLAVGDKEENVQLQQQIPE